ncbi:hypothetical protein MXMO3_03475 (plasmid) [Maritalea myrionectae]|uniref:Sulfotransferase family protein n=1 Tax=Maritalea myrionectae TaxID=454601 RepID=A0A2R4MIY9_9HYPH|nr:hypothetical protein [Maritalea myrionectae]AVX05978.1 hypothetical protein MXMO3_03475 [Maritalea myrionectae]
MSKNNRRPFFYILPRTSSTSLTKYLDEAFGENNVFVHKVLQDVYEGRPVTSETKSPAIEDLKKHLQKKGDFKAFVVMAPFGVHKYVPHNNLDLITILRDPIERCMSLIRLMKRNASVNSLNKFVDDLGSNWKEKINHRDLICLRNEQSRMIGNLDEWEVRDQHLPHIEKNLSKFTHVFRFGDIKNIIAAVQEYGGLNAAEFSHLNGADITLHEQERLKQVLLKNNKIDIELYSRLLAIPQAQSPSDCREDDQANRG